MALNKGHLGKDSIEGWGCAEGVDFSKGVSYWFNDTSKRFSSANEKTFNKESKHFQQKKWCCSSTNLSNQGYFFLSKIHNSNKKPVFQLFLKFIFNFFYSVNWRWCFCSTFVPKCDYSWWKITNSSQRALEHFSKTSKTICCQKKPFSW